MLHYVSSFLTITALNVSLSLYLIRYISVAADLLLALSSFHINFRESCFSYSRYNVSINVFVIRHSFLKFISLQAFPQNWYFVTFLRSSSQIFSNSVVLAFFPSNILSEYLISTDLQLFLLQLFALLSKLNLNRRLGYYSK